jgi:hypothetical protein
LKQRTDKISLYYSIADTLTESRQNDERIDFDKKDSKKVKNIVGNVLKSKTKVSKNALTKKLKSIKPKKEIDELVDSDGSMLSSKIPFLNQTLTPHKTTDQTVAMARITNDPVTRGYRVYYGESEEKSDEVINEVDYSEAFGYEETKDMDFDDTVKTLEEMGVENAIERAKQFGKLPKEEIENGELRQRLSEKDSIEEQQKQKMIKMVEDMLTKKSKSSDVVKKSFGNSDVIKNKGVSKILLKNIESIKKIADKEGISINMLIKALKSNE